MEDDDLEPLSTALGQILQRAKVPEDLLGWLEDVRITGHDSFALMACSEDEVDAKIIHPFLSNGGKALFMADRVAIKKAWTKCRRQMNYDNKTGGNKKNTEDLPEDVPEELRNA